MNSINDIIIVDDFDPTFGVTNIEHLPAHLLKQKTTANIGFAQSGADGRNFSN